MNEWQIKQIQEAMKEIEDGTATYISHEDVVKWVESWGTENELPIPTASNIRILTAV